VLHLTLHDVCQVNKVKSLRSFYYKW